MLVKYKEKIEGLKADVC